MIGQVINVPVDVDNMVKQLSCHLDNYAFNVNIKKHLVHKSSYLGELVKKRVVKEWLRYMVIMPLHKCYNIMFVEESLQFLWHL